MRLIPYYTTRAERMQTKHRKITVKCVDKDIFPMNWGCESQIESGFIVRSMTVCRVRQTAAKQATAAGRLVNPVSRTRPFPARDSLFAALERNCRIPGLSRIGSTVSLSHYLTIPWVLSGKRLHQESADSSRNDPLTGNLPVLSTTALIESSCDPVGERSRPAQDEYPEQPRQR